MSSFRAWSDDVFLWQVVESNALLSLSASCDAAMMVLEGRLTSRRQMPSFTAWFEAVSLCQIVESKLS